MIFKVTFKDPDALYDAISDGVKESLEKETTLSESEKEAVSEKRAEEAREICGKWFEYGEYLTVEIDTKLQTIKVVPTE